MYLPADADQFVLKIDLLSRKISLRPPAAWCSRLLLAKLFKIFCSARGKCCGLEIKQKRNSKQFYDTYNQNWFVEADADLL